MLYSVQQAQLGAKQLKEQDCWELIEDHLMVEYKENMPAAEQSITPAEAQQQGQASAKPALVQKSHVDHGSDIKSAAIHMPVESEATVADPAEVSHTAVQGSSRDQDLSSSKLPAGSKQDQIQASRTAVATTGKSSWLKRAVVVASRIVAVVVVARAVGKHK
jgi:hypothetical protein